MDSVLENMPSVSSGLQSDRVSRLETAKLKKFAQQARRSLNEQVQSKLRIVLAENSAARRENKQAVEELEKQIGNTSEERVVEKVAYTWFNRFCALRFMDVNRYSRIGIVSPTEGQNQPEILAEAKMGHIPSELASEDIQNKVFALLAGKATSSDPQAEAYRLLVVAVCNYYNRVMPYLFEKIADYTELLMPDDLLSSSSILAATREAMTPEACQDVEVIGWLYQFYISEKKDEVFEGLKKNKKITPENIPAATQLFTPRWIVQYLVENSLGRLWMLNRPNSRLVEKMPYYIKPEQVETDFLRISSPEEIKVCDPACGSGHMLVYAFDVLYAIYEEEGYDAVEIPELILKKNLYGIEIDERAAELAALALTMKARGKYKRFFEKRIQPNICALEPIKFTKSELDQYMDFVGRDLFTSQVEETLHQFEEADNFGSLIHPKVSKVSDVLALLDEKGVAGNLFLNAVHDRVLQALNQADYLGPKYHIIIANPPYMGGKGMNSRMADWVKKNFPDSKSDLFAMFIERGLKMVVSTGYSAMVTMEAWMFLSSYESLRTKLLSNTTLISMLHMPYLGKGGTSMGISFGTSATVFHKGSNPKLKGHFCCVRYYETDSLGVPREFPVKNERLGLASTEDFKKLSGSPIAYWVSGTTRSIFENSPSIGQIALPKQGSTIGDNEQFLRLWFEISPIAGSKWVKTVKGGDFRRWYGNHLYVVNWGADGSTIRSTGRATIRNSNYLFSSGIEWSRVTSAITSFRVLPEGFFHESASGVAFPDLSNQLTVLGVLNTKVIREMLGMLNPTMTFQSGDVSRLPFISANCQEIVKAAIRISKNDWNSSEISWDFDNLQLLHSNYHNPTIKATSNRLRSYWQEMTLELQRLEEENNRIFMEAYGLKDDPKVPLNEITLTCNPHYRYGGGKSEEELEALLLADTMKEYISYAVGCMLGRYALEKPGLILANQGKTFEDYLKQVPEPSFPADEDNVIPILDGEWFTDDITERFYKFLKVTFGEEHFLENLAFIEKAIGKDVRKYFIKDFYNDHVKRYKKRPIYWLFSSPKGSFNALIYMHRYRPDTVSVVLNDYLREFRTKLTARVEHLKHVEASSNASQAEKAKAVKEMENLKKVIAEINDYEQSVLYPLATQQIEIDLDDGVKVNYLKFGNALKKIPGLEAKED